MTKARYKAPVKRIELVTIVERSELEWEAGASRASRGVANGDYTSRNTRSDVEAEGERTSDRKVVRELNGELRLRLALEETTSGRVANGDDASGHTRSNVETEGKRSSDREVVRKLHAELWLRLAPEEAACGRVADGDNATWNTRRNVKT